MSVTEYTKRLTLATALLTRTMPDVGDSMVRFKDIIDGSDSDDEMGIAVAEERLGELAHHHADLNKLCNSVNGHDVLWDYAAVAGRGTTNSLLDAILKKPFLLKHLEGGGWWIYWFTTYLKDAVIDDSKDLLAGKDSLAGDHDKMVVAAAAILGRHIEPLSLKIRDLEVVVKESKCVDDKYRSHCRVQHLRELMGNAINMCEGVMPLWFLGNWLNNLEEESTEDLINALVEYPFFIHHITPRGKWVRRACDYLKKETGKELAVTRLHQREPLAPATV
jgi:hypothetical protein